MRPLRIMLVDDHETVRQGVRVLFQSVPGVEVIHDVGTGDAGIAAVRALAPDLVVVDLSMEPTDGLTVMRRLREFRRQTKVVVLSRYREAGYVREAIAAGAVGYVLKQSPFTELRRAVEAATRGETHLDPALGPLITQPETVQAGPQPSARGHDVLRWSALGETNREIAFRLGISVKTVEQHKSNAMKHLGLRDRAQLIKYAAAHGWLNDD